MSLPRNISAAAAARRALLFDVLLAVAIAVLSYRLAAGVGVVGFIAILVLLVLLIWIGAGAVIRCATRHRRARAPRPPRRPESRRPGTA